MKIHKVIVTDKGRVTIQINSHGTPEVKVKVGGTTHKISCPYENIRDIEAVVHSLLWSKVE